MLMRANQGAPLRPSGAPACIGEHPDIAQNWALVELTGFEPVAPSLRKMRSNGSDQGF